MIGITHRTERNAGRTVISVVELVEVWHVGDWDVNGRGVGHWLLNQEVMVLIKRGNEGLALLGTMGG